MQRSWENEFLSCRQKSPAPCEEPGGEIRGLSGSDFRVRWLALTQRGIFQEMVPLFQCLQTWFEKSPLRSTIPQFPRLLGPQVGRPGQGSAVLNVKFRDFQVVRVDLRPGQRRGCRFCR